MPADAAAGHSRATVRPPGRRASDRCPGGEFRSEGRLVVDVHAVRSDRFVASVHAAGRFEGRRVGRPRFNDLATSSRPPGTGQVRCSARAGRVWLHRVMEDMDLDRLPNGVRGWGAFVRWAADGDDRLERYFLELKSEVDLNTQHGRHKVAKFILGAANRNAAHAARRLGGHAVMLLGVGDGRTTGIRGFEAKDLEREVRKFAGADGPGWDYERIPVNGDRDVIAIIVDPPTGRVWPCQADGEGLKNGDVYLRGDGDTRKATGAELTAMLTRMTPSDALPPLAVQMEGEVLAVLLNHEQLREWVSDTAESYFDVSLDRFATPLMERRSADEFEREVSQWRERALAAPATGLHEVVGRFGTGLRLRIVNPARTPLREVRLDVYVNAATAVRWEERREGEDVEIFPDRPLEWGRDSYLVGHSGLAPYDPGDTRDRATRIVQENPARISFSIDLLRPLEEVVSDDDDVVLFFESDAEGTHTTPVRWTLSSGNIPDLLEGETTLNVEFMDLSDLVAVVDGVAD